MSATTGLRSPLCRLPVLAYDLSNWRGFLLPIVIPDTVRLKVIVGESTRQILERVPEDFAGAFAFHINLTDSSTCPLDRPRLVANLRARGIRTLNADVNDISKRFVQAACERAGLRTTTAARKGPASDVLIVKTNRNYGGVPEANLESTELHKLGISAHAVCRRADHGYFVASRRHLPATIWNNPNLVIERYIENRSQLFYRIYMMCDRFAISEGREHAHVKTIGRSSRQRLCLFSIDAAGNMDTAVPSDLLSAVHAVLSFVSITGMDFGCLDMLRDDSDQFYIVDMNPTASWGSEREVRIVEHLAPRREGQWALSHFF